MPLQTDFKLFYEKYLWALNICHRHRRCRCQCRRHNFYRRRLEMNLPSESNAHQESKRTGLIEENFVCQCKMGTSKSITFAVLMQDARLCNGIFPATIQMDRN